MTRVQQLLDAEKSHGLSLVRQHAVEVQQLQEQLRNLQATYTQRVRDL